MKQHRSPNGPGRVEQPCENESRKKWTKAQWVPLSDKVSESEKEICDDGSFSKADPKDSCRWNPNTLEDGQKKPSVECLFGQRDTKEMGSTALR